MEIQKYKEGFYELASQLRGFFPAYEYGKILLPLIFLKRIDYILEPNKKEVLDFCKGQSLKRDKLINLIINKFDFDLFNTSNFDLCLLKESKEIYKDFQDYLNGFSPVLKEIIDNLIPDFLIERLSKSEIFPKLIGDLHELNLGLEAINDQEMGELYEYFLDFYLRVDELGELTSHYTPREILGLMAKITFADTNDDSKNNFRDSKSIYDGCLGTGGLLIYANNEFKGGKNNKKLDIYGQELNSYSYAICKASLLMNGLDIKNIKLGDSLSSSSTKKEDFNYLLSVPPFGQNWISQKELIQKSSLGTFAPALPRKSDSSFLFLLDQINRMNPESNGGARSSVLLFKSALTYGTINSGENKIREYLIKEDLIESIIALPENLFYSTSIPTFIWTLSNKKSKKLKNKICFIDARSCIISKDKKKILRSKKEIIPNHEIESIQKSYIELIENGSSDDPKFQLIDSNKLVQKEVLITIENENFIEDKIKMFNTTIADKNEINNLTKNHPWLGKELTANISKESLVKFDILEIFNKKLIDNKISSIESEYSNYKKINFGQIIIDINFRRKYAGSINSAEKNNADILKDHSSAIYIYFSGGKGIKFHRKLSTENFYQIAQVILNEKFANPDYLVKYFNSNSGQETLFNLIENYSGFREGKILKNPLIISEIELPLPDKNTQQEILDIGGLPERLINSLSKMSKEINLNPTTSPVIRKKLLEMIKITEELTIEDKIKELIRNGENKKLEFKETFSLNMHTLKKDPIIRHSALKTIAAFLNSDGGTLLIGVTDKGFCKGCFDEITKLHKGIEDNLLKNVKDSIRDFIGLEFSEFYKLHALHLDKNVLLLRIDCSRSTHGCFIGDDFYVRTNPGTDKLTGKKLFDYSRTRFESNFKEI